MSMANYATPEIGRGRLALNYAFWSWMRAQLEQFTIVCMAPGFPLWRE